MLNLLLLNKELDPNKITITFLIDFTQWLLGIDWCLEPYCATYITLHFLCFSLTFSE